MLSSSAQRSDHFPQHNTTWFSRNNAVSDQGDSKNNMSKYLIFLLDYEDRRKKHTIVLLLLQGLKKTKNFWVAVPPIVAIHLITTKFHSSTLCHSKFPVQQSTWWLSPFRKIFEQKNVLLCFKNYFLLQKSLSCMKQCCGISKINSLSAKNCCSKLVSGNAL